MKGKNFINRFGLGGGRSAFLENLNASSSCLGEKERERESCEGLNGRGIDPPQWGSSSEAAPIKCDGRESAGLPTLSICESVCLPEAAPIKCDGRESAGSPTLSIKESVGLPALSI